MSTVKLFAAMSLFVLAVLLLLIAMHIIDLTVAVTSVLFLLALYILIRDLIA